jgi:hypothetical protein
LLRLWVRGRLLRLLPDALRAPASARADALPRLAASEPRLLPWLLPRSDSCLLLCLLLLRVSSAEAGAAAAAVCWSLLLRGWRGPSSHGCLRASAAVARSLGSKASMGSRKSAKPRAWG